ncbi:hypothetical protein [Pengzhenrongella sicca]|uniref:Uncharacterized protein n=1 Tax=Pengzhenrongella sicca TaxID=2819238 RepID=A0A8A4ZFS6_9MICO|nr:hypothetical protein [Pengzhenrongella sicca]QTE30862.1 hypothetical protein J4E96_08015 [Pengzhenrongella sicca]
MASTPHEGHAIRRDRLETSSIWARCGLVVVIVAPWMLAISPALFDGRSSSGPAIGSLIGVLVGSSLRDRKFLKLSGSARRRVIAVQRSGQRSGDPLLDKIALERLQRAVLGFRSDRIVMPILLAILVAIPVIAAVRDGGWWLLCLLPGAVVAVVLPAPWARLDPRVQRDLLLRTAAS